MALKRGPDLALRQNLTQKLRSLFLKLSIHPELAIVLSMRLSFLGVYISLVMESWVITGCDFSNQKPFTTHTQFFAFSDGADYDCQQESSGGVIPDVIK